MFFERVEHSYVFNGDKESNYHFWPTSERSMDDKFRAIFKMCFHICWKQALYIF